MIYLNNKDKLQKLKFTKDNYYVVSDFDQTITAGFTKGSWGIDIKRAESYIEEKNNLYNYYRPIEIDNTISKDKKFKLMEEWYEKSLELLLKYKIKEQEIVEACNSGMFVLRSRS